MKRSTREEIEGFAKAVDLALGHADFPLAMTGDLSDLLGTLQEGGELLARVLASENQKDAARHLHRLEIYIESDLPMVLSDLLPSVREVVGKIYARNRKGKP